MVVRSANSFGSSVLQCKAVTNSATNFGFNEQQSKVFLDLTLMFDNENCNLSASVLALIFDNGNCNVNAISFLPNV